MPRARAVPAMTDLPAAVVEALAPFHKLTSTPEFSEDAFGAAEARVDAAWHALLAAERENPLLDLRRPMQIRAVLKAAFAARGDIPNAHERLVVAAALYFAETDDGSDDLANAWGFDDDQVVVDAVITFLNQRGSSLATTADIFRPGRAKRTPTKRAAKHTLPPLTAAVRSALTRLPEPLARALLEGAEQAVAAAKVQGVDALVADLLVRAATHVERARARAAQDHLVAVKVANSVAADLTRLLVALAPLSAHHDRVLPLVIAAGELFVLTRDGDDDFASSFGFDDDRAAMTAVMGLVRQLTPRAEPTGA